MLKDVSFKTGEGISSIVVDTGKPIILQDVSQDKRFLYYKEKITDIGSFMSLPLKMSNEKIMGVLNIHKREKNAFKESDVTLFQAIAENIAHTIEKSRAFEKLKNLSIFDDLTNLYTRRYFFENGFRECNDAKRHGNVFSIIMMDIDNFKYFNDTYGHPQGDEILKKVAFLLKTNVRIGDIAARYGGEEFVTLLPNTCKDDAVAIAEKLRAMIEQQSNIETGKDTFGKVTITAGVAAYLEDGDTLENVIAQADKFMYIGKNSGKNKIISAIEGEDKYAGTRSKRLTKRHKVGLKVVKNTNIPNFIEIRINNDTWSVCNVVDISKNGLRGVVEHDIRKGDIYECKVKLNSGIDASEIFIVKIIHIQKIFRNRYFFGAHIEDKKSHWGKNFGLMYH